MARIIAVLLLLTAIALPVYAQSQTPIVKRDADEAAVEQILQSQGYSRGEDGMIYVAVQPESITGYVPLDNAVLFVWNNCGKLMILFGMFAMAYIIQGKLNGGLTYGEYLRREAADRWAEDQGEDIHNPFASPRGMRR